MLNTLPGHRAIRFQHRSALNEDVVLLAFAESPVCSFGIGTASLSKSRTVGKTGAAWANSGKTTSLTGRNGALPTTAASIIATIRSVFALI